MGDQRRVSDIVIGGYTGDTDLVDAAMSDPDPQIRAAALGAAHRLGRLNPDRHRQALADPDARVRCRAVELAALGAETAPTVDPAPLLADPDPTVVELACFACGEVDWTVLGVEPPVAALAAVATGHADPLCRESAAAALGAIGRPDGLAAVLAACEDRVTVRRRAILALAAFDDPRADQALHHALEDKDWQVRQAAEDLLEVARRL